MRISRVVNHGVLVAVLVSAVSFFIKLIPCKREAGWGFCKLPNPFKQTITNTTEFYGLSADPLAALVFQFVVAFGIVFLGLSLFRRKARHIANA